MNDNKLVIGVVGGMGPYATVDFYKRLVDAFPTEKDWQKPRIIIDSYATIPSRVRAVLYNEKKEELLTCMTSSVKNLIHAGANQIIIACNTAHVFLPEVIKRVPESENFIINLIKETANVCEKKGYRKVRLLASEGTVQTGIYKKVFYEHGIEIIDPNHEELVEIRKLIEDVKQNKVCQESNELFLNMVLRSRGIADAVILGCTELPVYMDEYRKQGENVSVIDPLQVAIDILVDLG